MEVGRDSSVGIAKRYGLDCPRIESRRDEIFHPRPGRTCGPPASCTVGTGLSWPGRGVDYPPLSSAEATERVVLYLYSVSGFS